MLKSPRTLSLCAVALLAIVGLAGCRPASDDGANVDGGNVVLPPISLPVAETPLNREALLLAVIRAGSAHAAGTDDSAEQRKLDGKPFELRIRFGCPGVSNENPALSASVGSDGSSLALSATPNLELDDPAIATLGIEQFEAVEGFWLGRPWMLTAACSPAPATATETAAAPADAAVGKAAPLSQAPAEGQAERLQIVGIAQFFTQTDRRTGRRDRRPYSVSEPLPAGSAASNTGYELVLSGRLRRLPGGKVISCASLTAQQPPTCVISAEFDLVRFERPDTREVLAEWS